MHAKGRGAGSVGGTDTGAVTLYSDEACETPVTPGAAASTPTAYVKAISVGSTSVTVAGNADDS